jgi:hypothetical protein
VGAFDIILNHVAFSWMEILEKLEVLIPSLEYDLKTNFCSV